MVSSLEDAQNAGTQTNQYFNKMDTEVSQTPQLHRDDAAYSKMAEAEGRVTVNSKQANHSKKLPMDLQA